MGGFTEFEQAFNLTYVGAGALIGGVVFAGCAWAGAPVFFTYGIVRGLNQTLPFVVIPSHGKLKTKLLSVLRPT